MRIAIVFGLALIVAMPSCVMAQSAIRQYPTTIKLKIDTRGQVTEVGTPDRLPAMLVAPVRNAAKAWRFKPLKANGQAASVTTFAYATVEIIERSDNHYGLRVLYRRNGPKLLIRPPRYPGIWFSMGLEPQLLFAITVNPDGSLTDVHMIKSHGGNRSRTFFRGVKELRDAVEQHWHALPMRINGKPAFTHIQTSIAFSSSGSDKKHMNASDDRDAPAWTRAPSDGLIASDSPLHRLPDSSHAAAGIHSDTGT